MSATYDDTLPTDRDKARSILGATDVTSETTALVSDEHIDAVLTWKDSLDGAVSFLASELASRFAQLPSDVTLPSGLRASWASRISNWQKLAGVASTGGVSGGSGLSFVTASYGSESNTDEFARPESWFP